MSTQEFEKALLSVMEVLLRPFIQKRCVMCAGLMHPNEKGNIHDGCSLMNKRRGR
jgi:hypothetical protein